MPPSKLKVEIAKILKSEGFISNFKVVGAKDGKPQGDAPRAAQVRRRAASGYHRHRARLPPGPPRLRRPRRRSRRCSAASASHPLDLAGRDDRHAKPQGRRRRRGPLRGLVRQMELSMSRIGRKPIRDSRRASRSTSTADAVEVRARRASCARRCRRASASSRGRRAARPSARRGARARAFHGLVRASSPTRQGRDRRLQARARHRRRRLPRRGEGQAGASSRSATRTRCVFDIPKGSTSPSSKQTHITVTGIDRQQVGQVAAEIRALRKPDPYKGKGIKYTDEVMQEEGRQGRGEVASADS